MPRPARNAARRKARRVVLPGFPIEEPFESIEAVRAYLQGPRVQCLRCGKLYKDVGKHVHMHGMTPDEYREMYRIPWTYGLVCPSTHAAYSDSTQRQIAEARRRGKVWGCTDDEFLRGISQAALRRAEPYKHEIAMDNLAKYTANKKKEETS